MEKDRKETVNKRSSSDIVVCNYILWCDKMCSNVIMFWLNTLTQSLTSVIQYSAGFI